MNLIINIIENFTYIGIIFLIAIENLFPPIPSELILAFAGFFAKTHNLNIFLLIISSTIGSIIGALILYYFGSLLKFDTTSSLKYFNKLGPSSIFLCRFIPVLRSLISIPAGLAKINIFIFLILTTLGSLIWNTIIILIGNTLGNNWKSITIYINTYKYILIIFAIGFILFKIVKKRVKQ